MHSLKAIKAMLTDKNLSAVAKKTGLHTETVRRIATGISTNPDYKTLEALSDYIDEQLEAIKGGE
jgi:transcriptional regulator with XRE-family HTH domain